MDLFKNQSEYNEKKNRIKSLKKEKTTECESWKKVKTEIE